MTCIRTLQAIGCASMRRIFSIPELRMAYIAAVCAAALLAGCTTKPSIIKEPYKVTEVREVYRPIPDEYTRKLEAPELPNTPTVLDLVNYAKALQALAETANEHRAAVKRLEDGK